MRLILLILVGLSLAVGACASEASEASDPTTTELPLPDANASSELFPDVVGATAAQADDGTWTFSVTLSSPYDSPERYADSWRVRSDDGTVFGERFLTHDHASEQPFTRSQGGISIPDEVDTVIIEGRDQISGWGGTSMVLDLDRS